jgi:hypothetical protein
MLYHKQHALDRLQRFVYNRELVLQNEQEDLQQNVQQHQCQTHNEEYQ